MPPERAGAASRAGSRGRSRDRDAPRPGQPPERAVDGGTPAPAPGLQAQSPPRAPRRARIPARCRDRLRAGRGPATPSAAWGLWTEVTTPSRLPPAPSLCSFPPPRRPALSFGSGLRSRARAGRPRGLRGPGAHRWRGQVGRRPGRVREGRRAADSRPRCGDPEAGFPRRGCPRIVSSGGHQEGFSLLTAGCLTVSALSF